MKGVYLAVRTIYIHQLTIFYKALLNIILGGKCALSNINYHYYMVLKANIPTESNKFWFYKEGAKVKGKQLETTKTLKTMILTTLF